ncbi:hypothetical protein [Flavobacterium praedii]|uniref:hypothetical protein n=1 Tax=Flavobacterium praedii TaxID=3002900 RepID=UPI002481F2AF|nr:hypothetical protein [Flavobacterium praedii]
MIDERQQKIELLLLNNGFKLSNKNDNYYTKNNTSILFKKESIFLYINKYSKNYSTWDLGQYPTENEIKNLIFFSILDNNDKVYLYKKIDPLYRKSCNRDIIEKILNFDKQIELIEANFYEHQIVQIKAFHKRKVMYYCFNEKWALNKFTI